jgi:diguanylate cyclase (GGDEF)-like protein
MRSSPLQAVQVLERVRFYAELQNLALCDPLTGLANRTLLQHALNAALLNGRHPTGLGVIVHDLDSFKAVNIGLGHHANGGTLPTA